MIDCVCTLAFHLTINETCFNTHALNDKNKKNDHSQIFL